MLWNGRATRNPPDPSLDQNNDEYDNKNNNVKDNNFQHLLHIYQIQSRHYYKLSMHINLFNTYSNLGGSYCSHTYFTDEKMEAGKLTNLPKARRPVEDGAGT